MQKLIIIFLKLYQRWISPIFGMMGAQCRFHPSCSEYAIGAFARFNFFKACWLVVHRLGRCHPWCEGGLDPVPELKGELHEC